jgi:hypothetical protein
LRMHLAWRWFTGLGFDQEIPHHSPDGEVLPSAPGYILLFTSDHADGSSVPRWLEFGLLKKDETLWVEVFDN